MKKVYVRIRTKEQYKALAGCPQEWGLILDAGLLNVSSGTKDAAAPAYLTREVYFALPEVARQKRIRQIEEMIRQCPDGAGLVVCNPDELGLIKRAGYQGPLLADASLYAYNREAMEFYLEIFPQMQFLCSDELTDRELEALGRPERMICKVYGYQELMISEQCLSRNETNCREKRLSFRDEKGERFYAVSDCALCSSHIYNGKPTYMLDKLEEIGFSRVLLDFTLESGKEMQEILRQCEAFLQADGKKEPAGAADLGSRQITRGHHYSGID